jgi:hypothetical protein
VHAPCTAAVGVQLLSALGAVSTDRETHWDVMERRGRSEADRVLAWSLLVTRKEMTDQPTGD